MRYLKKVIGEIFFRIFGLIFFKSDPERIVTPEGRIAKFAIFFRRQKSDSGIWDVQERLIFFAFFSLSSSNGIALCANSTFSPYLSRYPDPKFQIFYLFLRSFSENELYFLKPSFEPEKSFTCLTPCHFSIRHDPGRLTHRPEKFCQYADPNPKIFCKKYCSPAFSRPHFLDAILKSTSNLAPGACNFVNSRRSDIHGVYPFIK